MVSMQIVFYHKIVHGDVVFGGYLPGFVQASTYLPARFYTFQISHLKNEVDV